MKRFFLITLLTLLLTSCNPLRDFELEYDLEDFYFEVNEPPLNYDSFFDVDIEVDFDFDDTDIDFGTLGEYELGVTVTNGGNVKEYTIPVHIVDTTPPEINIPSTLINIYDPGSTIDLSEITVSDNSGEELVFESNVDEIDMNVPGTYTVELGVVDSSGNEGTNSFEVTVSEYDIPTVNITDLIVGQDSLEFMVSKMDPYDLIESIEVTVEDQFGNVILLRTINSNPEIHLTDLNFGQDYTVILDYTYRFEEGGELEEASKENIYTLLYLAVPQVTLDTISVDEIELSIDASVNDPDGAVKNVFLRIYDSSEVLQYEVDVTQELGEYTINDLVELRYGETYRVDIDVVYEIEKGVNTTATFDTQTRMTADIIVSDVTLSAMEISRNEMMNIIVDTSNETYPIEEFIMNGEVYVSNGGSFNFQVGSTIETQEFTITEVKVDGYQLSITPYTFTVDVKGELPITYIELDTDAPAIGDPTLIYISLDNPSEHDIVSVSVNGVVYPVSAPEVHVSLDMQEIQLELLGCSVVCNIEYVIDDITYMYNGTDEITGTYLNVSEHVHYGEQTSMAISSQEDFENICYNPEGNYHLTQSIDLNGSSWYSLPCEFNGFLDGRGYAIENISLTTDGNVGIFSSIGPTGFVKNLEVLNMNVVVSNGSQLTIGLLADNLSGHIEDIIVTGVLDVDTISNTGAVYSYGGVVGSSTSGIFVNVYSDVNIDSDAAPATIFSGNIVGQCHNCKLFNVKSEGMNAVEHNSVAVVGGIIGYSTNTDMNLVSSYVSISVNASSADSAGIIAGYTESSTIKNFYVEGSITSISASSSIGGVVGDSAMTVIKYGIVNVYLQKVIAFDEVGSISGISGIHYELDVSHVVVLTNNQHIFLIPPLVPVGFNGTTAYVSSPIVVDIENVIIHSSSSIYIDNNMDVNVIYQGDTTQDVLLFTLYNYQNTLGYDYRYWTGIDATTGLAILEH